MSGYDAGPSWSITTQANLDPATLSASTTSVWSVDFSATTGSTIVDFLGSFSAPLSDYITDSISLYNGDSTTMSGQLSTFLMSIVNSNALSATTGAQWGVMTDSVYNAFTGDGYTISDSNNQLSVDGLYNSVADYDDSLMDPWYYGCFEPGTGDNYSGISFNAAVTTLDEFATDSFSGTVSGTVVNYVATAFTEYNDLVVATLRSRGINNNSDGGPVYMSSGTSQVVMDVSGTYVDVLKNPYSSFGISGVTNDGDNFTFKTSFTLTDTNYLSKVFGGTNFGKNRTEVPLFIEETYYNLLTNGYRLGKIRGLNSDLTALPSAREDVSNTSIGWYLEQYQTPATPYLVSELRGSQVDRLFRVILISDGNVANNLVKISVANISFANLTFDVLVRDYFDTDANPVILEKFTNCSLNPGENNFVAKKVGTSNGEFELKSKFIMLEMDEDAPIDALPCGFEGYVFREYSGVKSPFIVYKTKYNTPGEVIYNPPFGTNTGSDNSTRSAGDKVRKTYLGVSNTVGIDPDFFKYGGKQNPTNIATATEGNDWAYLTKGFHMDSGATVVSIAGGYVTSGETAFEVGDAEFQK